MSDDELSSLMAQYARAVFDPTAPLPMLWPTGLVGVFLIFLLPTAAGVPLGVIMARSAGIPPVVTAGLYFASDVLAAVLAEPTLMLVRRIGTRFASIARVGDRLGHMTEDAGLRGRGVRGPLGLIAVSFMFSPLAGRVAGVAAGYRVVSSWSLAIIGDMVFFGLLMATTLWLTGIFGDSRLLIGALVVGPWLAPMLIRRLRRRYATPPARRRRATRARHRKAT